jgi:hypothetical protein
MNSIEEITYKNKDDKDTYVEESYTNIISMDHNIKMIIYRWSK